MQTIKYLGLIALLFGILSACKDAKTPAQDTEQTITILQTADIHGQLFPHDELFWENEQITFRKLGGLAHVKTLFEEERSKNPKGTLIWMVATSSKGVRMPHSRKERPSPPLSKKWAMIF